MDILIGADPEFFLRDKETGKFVSAYGMIPGTKEEPHEVECGAIQVDGMAVEFNINPAANEDEFVHNINTVLNQLREMIDDKYEFVFEPVAMFDKEYLKTQPKEALILGCEPDFNAWENGEPNPAPDPGDIPFRTASGHVHIGWTKNQEFTQGHMQACKDLCRILDITLASPSCVWDRDEQRVNLYGNLGAFRPKHYGVEYRTLSNAWLAEEIYVRLVYRLTSETVQKMTERGPKIVDDFATNWHLEELRKRLRNKSNVEHKYIWTAEDLLNLNRDGDNPNNPIVDLYSAINLIESCEQLGLDCPLTIAKNKYVHVFAEAKVKKEQEAIRPQAVRFAGEGGVGWVVDEIGAAPAVNIEAGGINPVRDIPIDEDDFDIEEMGVEF